MGVKTSQAFTAAARRRLEKEYEKVMAEMERKNSLTCSEVYDLLPIFHSKRLLERLSGKEF